MSKSKLKIYLYLEKKEWADTWINGGEVPIYLASKYLSNHRQGIKTPDENNQRNLKNLSESYLKTLTNADDLSTESKNTINISVGTYSVNNQPIAKKHRI